MNNKRFIRYASLITLLIFFVMPSHTFATKWAYPFVVWEGYTYEVIDEPVTEIDRKIGKVSKYSDMETYPGNFSNAYKKGTTYYSIKDVSTDEAIAVQVENGTYVKAIRRGEYLGGSTSMINSPSPFLVVGAFLAVAFLLTASILYVNRYRNRK
jgi:hypothetical protein